METPTTLSQGPIYEPEGILVLVLILGRLGAARTRSGRGVGSGGRGARALGV